MPGKNSGYQGFLGFAKSTLIFFVGNTLSKIITLLLLPLYTYMLPASDYGYYDLSITCVTLLTSFLYCDIWSSVMRFMRDDLEGEAPGKIVMAGWRIFAVSSSLFVAIAVIGNALFGIQSIEFIIAYGLAHNFQSMFSCITRGWAKNVSFAISGVLNTVINVGLNVLLILVLRLGFESLYIAFTAGCIVQCAYLFIALKMWRNMFVPDKGQTTELFRYSAPLCINSVAYWLLTSLSRVVVTYALSLAANGVFAIGAKFGSTIALATTCFTYAWQDIAFTKEVRETPFYSGAVAQYSGFLMAAVAVLLPAISLAFPILVGPDYSEAYDIVPSFLWVSVASAVSTFVGNIFYVIKDTKAISKSMVISCLTNVAICYPLTIWLGCLGANIAVLIAFIENILIRFSILKKSIGFEMNWASMGPHACLLFIASIAYMVNTWFVEVVMLVIAICACLALYRQRLNTLVNLIRKR